MEYEGKLYGKVGTEFLPLLPTTEDWNAMEKRIAELEEQLAFYNQSESTEQRYPELTQRGKEDAQVLMNRFEAELKAAAVEIFKDFSNRFYSDIVNEVESDHWQNYRTKILNDIKGYFVGKKERKHEADEIRMAIYRNHKDEIVKDLNQDLVEENKIMRMELSKIDRNFS